MNTNTKEQIMEFLKTGYTIEQIAEMLRISKHTVKAYSVALEKEHNPHKQSVLFYEKSN